MKKGTGAWAVFLSLYFSLTLSAYADRDSQGMSLSEASLATLIWGSVGEMPEGVNMTLFQNIARYVYPVLNLLSERKFARDGQSEGLYRLQELLTSEAGNEVSFTHRLFSLGNGRKKAKMRRVEFTSPHFKLFYELPVYRENRGVLTFGRLSKGRRPGFIQVEVSEPYWVNSANRAESRYDTSSYEFVISPVQNGEIFARVVNPKRADRFRYINVKMPILSSMGYTDWEPVTKKSKVDSRLKAAIETVMKRNVSLLSMTRVATAIKFNQFYKKYCSRKGTKARSLRRLPSLLH